MSSYLNIEAFETASPGIFPEAKSKAELSIGSTAPFKPVPYLKATRFLHRILALLLLIPGLPIIAVAMALVRATSAGPAIYKQTRVGLSGRKFLLLKLRTMTHDAEAETGPVWTAVKDARITSAGRFLRKLHLDELPQLWNVLRGDMALIGPRPERPEFIVKLAPAIPNYLERLTALPGVTGLSQITFPPDLTLECVRRKLNEDLRYIESANFILDCRILICTAFRAAGLPGGTAARLMGFQQFASASVESKQHENVRGVRLAVAPLHEHQSDIQDSSKRKPR